MNFLHSPPWEHILMLTEAGFLFEENKMSKVGDWWYAYKVCSKYNILWNPFFTKEYAHFKFTYHTNYKKWNAVVTINPFYRGFLDSFLHEVGHLVRHRNAYLKANTEKEYLSDVSDQLLEEYKAWQFAKLARRSKFNSSRSRALFSTYLPAYKDAVGEEKAILCYNLFDGRLK